MSKFILSFFLLNSLFSFAQVSNLENLCSNLNGKSISDDYETLKKIIDNKKTKIKDKTLCVFKFFDLYGWNVGKNKFFYDANSYLPHPCGSKKMGFCYYDGSYMIKEKYTRCFDFSEGYARVEVDGKYGFIDRYGNEITPIKYDEAFDFRDGFALVRINMKSGFIDGSGKEIIEVKYENVFGPKKDLFAVKLNEKWGVILKEGKTVIPFDYDLIFLNDLIIIKKDNKYGIAGWNGNIIVEPKYDYIGSFSNGFAIVRIDGKYGLIDDSGKEVIKPKYDDIGDCDYYQNYIGLGKKKVDHCLFTNIFNDGVAPIKLNGKWGLVDLNGNEIVKPQYDEILEYRKNLVKAILNNRVVSIDISQINKK
jgi:hypothetical protein